MSEKVRFIFVGGCGRSGTSLVQKILVGHSLIAGGPELDHTAAIMGLHDEMSKDWRLRRQAAYYDRTTLDRAFTGFYEGLFASMAARKPSARFVSEKTPSNITVAESLLRLWPDSVFIAVVRDGRDVLLSHRDVNRRFREQGERNPERDSLLDVCRFWNHAADRYFAALAMPELRDRLMLVRFEDLVGHPHREVQRMCNALDLQVEDRQLRPESITERETGVELEGAYFTQELYRQPFNPAKIDRWQREMGPLDRRVVTSLLRHNLLRYGYAA